MFLGASKIKNTIIYPKSKKKKRKENPFYVSRSYSCQTLIKSFWWSVSLSMHCSGEVSRLTVVLHSTWSFPRFRQGTWIGSFLNPNKQSLPSRGELSLSQLQCWCAAPTSLTITSPHSCYGHQSLQSPGSNVKDTCSLLLINQERAFTKDCLFSLISSGAIYRSWRDTAPLDIYWQRDVKTLYCHVVACTNLWVGRVMSLLNPWAKALNPSVAPATVWLCFLK